MFDILIGVLQQIYEKLAIAPWQPRKALQHLFQTTLVVPEFDLVIDKSNVL